MEWKSKFNEPKESSGFLLWRVTQLWQRLITKELHKIELTHVQFVLLTACDFLFSKGELVTQKKLAEFTNTNIMMVSDVVRTLEKKSLLIRRKNPKDKREIHLSPTEEGSKKVTLALPLVEAIDEQFFSQLSTDQGDFNRVLQSLLMFNEQEDN